MVRVDAVMERKTDMSSLLSTWTECGGEEGAVLESKDEILSRFSGMLLSS